MTTTTMTERKMTERKTMSKTAKSFTIEKDRGTFVGTPGHLYDVGGYINGPAVSLYNR